jgi:uncharacterized protein YjdB
MPSVVRLTFCVTALAFVATAGGVTSCGEGFVYTGLPVDSSVEAVMVSPPSVSLAVGAKTTLAASVAGGPNLTDRTVTWSSSDTTVARVDSAGTVTALASGRTSIIAAAHAHPQVTGAAVVTVGL